MILQYGSKLTLRILNGKLGSLKSNRMILNEVIMRKVVNCLRFDIGLLNNILRSIYKVQATG